MTKPTQAPWEAERAFPFQGQQGLSLRDYFAAAALQGLLASGRIDAKCTAYRLALMAYDQADDMMEARKSSPVKIAEILIR